MATNVVFNGVTYSIPAEADDGWGPDLSSYFISIASNSLQKTGGSFALTAEADFGATYGLKSPYYTSKGTNPASSGALRLANAEGIYWRNAANNANLGLVVNSSNALQFNGATLLASGLIVNADIDAAAAIAYSKLNLAGSIVNADISNSAAIAYSKLNLSTSIVNADISASAAIAYSKLNLSTSIVNADIGASAAIAYSKLAALTASRVLVSDSSGFVSASSVTSTTLGYLDATSSIQTQIDGKTSKSTLTSKGDIYAATGSSTPTRVAVGTDGQVLTADSASSPGIKWADPAAAPSASYEISNLGLATSVSGNALTIALKQSDGSSNPSSGASAVKVGMRSGTLTSGSYNQRSVTSSLSLVISSGSTLGQQSGKPARVYIYLIDNSGTLELAASQALFDDTNVVSTTAEGGAGAADSASVIYSTTARSNVPIRLIGYLDNTQTTAGTWASAGTVLAVGGRGQLGVGTSDIKFIAGSSGGQSIGDTVINNWSASVDTHSALSSSTTWTVPRTGYYQINACYAVDVPASQPQVGNWAKIFVNGSELARGNTYSASLTYAATVSIGSAVSRLAYLIAGDAVTIKVEQNSGANRTGTGSGAYNWWTIHGLP